MKNKLLVISLAIFLLLPAIALANPILNSISNQVIDSGVNLQFTITSTSPDSGSTSFAKNVSFGNLNKNSDTQATFSWTPSASDVGAHQMIITALDSNSSSQQTITITVNANNNPPTATFGIGASTSGDIITQESVTLNITTDKNATCKYSQSDISYDSMSSTFSESNGINHYLNLELGSGEYTYYVRCRDSLGNTMQSSIPISFTVDLPPTAEITLSDPSPVREGVIKVTLLSSDRLKEPPTLTYSFNDAPSSRKPISLTGEDALWTGYMIVKQEDDNKVGTFYFSGKDMINNQGTEITQGSIFIVDTTKPGTVADGRTKVESDGDINLMWYYDGEEIETFNIYRSTTSGVKYVDYYDSTNDTDYHDSDTINQVTYYYRISVVDKAGNEGPLSDEIYATSVTASSQSSATTQQTTQAEDNTPKVLPPNLVPKVDAYIKKVDNFLIDIYTLIADLDKESDETKKSLISEFDLVGEAEKSELKLNSIKEDLEDLKLFYQTESELDSALKSTDMELKKIKSTLIKDITLNDETEFIQAVTKSDITEAIDKVASDFGFTDNDKRNYISINEKASKKLNVETKIKILTIKYLDLTKEDITVISKKVSCQSPEPANDILLIETIPKTVAEHVSDIKFDQSDYEVIEDDPVVKYGFVTLDYNGEEIRYSVKKLVSLTEAKKAKSVLLVSPAEVLSSSKITGYSVFSFRRLGVGPAGNFFIWFGIISIVSLTLYYYVFVKEGITIPIEFPNPLKQDKVTKKKPITEEQPHSSLDWSQLNNLQNHINNLRYEVADKIYPSMLSLYETATAGGVSKKKLNDAIKLINEAYSYLESNQAEYAKIVYPNIQKLYSELPKKLKSEIYELCVDIHKKIAQN